MKEPKFGKYITKSIDSEDWIRYKIDCGCIDDSHRLTMDIEFNKKYGDVSISFYENLYHFESHSYLPDNFYSDCSLLKEKVKFIFDYIFGSIKKYWSRFKMSMKILFLGEVMFEGYFGMYNLEHFDEFVKALLYARYRMKDLNKKDSNVQEKSGDSNG